jgi:hypothetical protein
MPRVGNQDFANWVDSNQSGQVTDINNKEDPIPIVPGIASGFVYVSGGSTSRMLAHGKTVPVSFSPYSLYLYRACGCSIFCGSPI